MPQSVGWQLIGHIVRTVFEPLPVTASRVMSLSCDLRLYAVESYKEARIKVG
jgi:hypothetical protein